MPDPFEHRAARRALHRPLDHSAADSQFRSHDRNAEIRVAVIPDQLDGPVGQIIGAGGALRGGLGVNREVGEQSDRLPGEFARVVEIRLVGGGQQPHELGREQRGIIELRTVAIQAERPGPHPLVEQIAIAADPE